MATRIFRRKNDPQINETWSPVLESHGVKDGSTKAWLAEYCHNHAISDNAGSLNEAAVAPGLFYQMPGSISAIGNPVAPTSSANGSGDKFPSLLPVAIQVATKTIAFDLVPVVPMDSPVGFLPYLDYVYQGGQVGSTYEPFLVKVDLSVNNVTSRAWVAGEYVTVGDMSVVFVGYSRFDGHPIFKVVTGTDGSTTIAAAIAAVGNTAVGSHAGTVGDPYVGFAFSGAITSAAVQLVSALENHISGFTSSSDSSYATDAWRGPYQPATGSVPNGMQRADGEAPKYRQMGLKMFTKFVEAKGEQVAISATVEQIQDLNKVWNYDVISMLENVATNEIAQSISKQLMDRMFNLGAQHATKVNSIEGTDPTAINFTVGAGFENVSSLQRRVATKMLELANLIYHRGRFGAGTFIVTNGRIASVLADISGYALAPFNNDLPSAAGQLYPAGKIYGLTVYVDPNLSWSDGRILIGRKGGDEEPGVKFCPYIIAESLQTISEGTMSPKIAMKSRYAMIDAGWHPEAQYLTLSISKANVDILTGSAALA